jgi:hypothetical protein
MTNGSACSFCWVIISGPRQTATPLPSLILRTRPELVPIFQPSQLLSVNYCLFSVVIVVGNYAMFGNFSQNIKKKFQVIQQDNATRKSQRVSIHIVFVTNKLVKSKPRLIRSIRSILQPCTATSDIFSLSRLAEPPPVQSTPQVEH